MCPNKHGEVIFKQNMINAEGSIYLGIQKLWVVALFDIFTYRHYTELSFWYIGDGNQAAMKREGVEEGVGVFGILE